MLYQRFIAILAVGVFVLLPLSSIKAQQETQPENSLRIGENAKRQIAALLADKKNRLARQQQRRRTGSAKQPSDKLHLSVRSAIGDLRGESLAANVPPMANRAERDAKSRVALDIYAAVNKKLLAVIKRNGGETFFSSVEYRFVQAYLPLEAVETIAAAAEVERIEFSRRVQVSSVRAGDAKEKSFLSNLISGSIFRNPSSTGSVVSQGDAAHRANLARTTFGVNGAGVKIAAMSDSVRFLERAQAFGDLPNNVTVLPGQSGIIGDGTIVYELGEGTAMLEIIHDLAPGAQLYFATGASNGMQNPVVFAQNIRALRDAGCSIIVDDLNATFGPDGTPFQEAIVSAAINDVTASGVLYVSSAGNDGNKADGTSGTWEGDFTPSGEPLVIDGVEYGEVHDFYTSDAGATNNSTTGNGQGAYMLWWADTFGGATIDYDLVLLSPDGTELIDASFDIQDGESGAYPFEAVFSGQVPLGSQIVVLRYDDLPPRALHFNSLGGTVLFNTDGAIRGHKIAAKALSIAATPSGYSTPSAGPAGPFPSAFRMSDRVERFSSDGPRRIFFNANNTPITPNNFLFSTNGGRLIQKVDFTGADGVSTTNPFPFLSTFFGTSAAAPHVAAIAALVKSANPRLTREQIIQVLTASAIDIETPGRDRDSGWGIVDAYRAVQAAGR